MAKISVKKPRKLWLVSRDGVPVVATPSKAQAERRARQIARGAEGAEESKRAKAGAPKAKSRAARSRAKSKK